jgi:quercetin dioxygenase-like cupin family protein
MIMRVGNRRWIMDEATFGENLTREGYTKVTEFIKDPNWADTEHSHDFDVYVLVFEGELMIEKKSGDVTCQVGDTVRYPAGELHIEKAGPNGVKALVRRRTVGFRL